MKKWNFGKFLILSKGNIFSFDNFGFWGNFQKFRDFQNFQRHFFGRKIFHEKKIENFIFLFFLNIPSVKFICTKGELLKVSVRYRTWLSDAIRYLTKMSKILRIWVKLHWSRSHGIVYLLKPDIEKIKDHHRKSYPKSWIMNHFQ